MDELPIGQEVVVTLADGSSKLAYWFGGQWWEGVENDPVDALVTEEVISWRWRTE